jgi:hypothetical protein
MTVEMDRFTSRATLVKERTSERFEMIYAAKRLVMREYLGRKRTSSKKCFPQKEQ